MTALEYILDGLEAALALERDLGVRFIELEGRQEGLQRPVCGLQLRQSSSASPSRENTEAPTTTATSELHPQIKHSNAQTLKHSNLPNLQTSTFDFIFLHHRPLGEKGEEMMSKIITAMGRTRQSAPIVTEDPIPAAKIYIVLGGAALKKWFPTRNASPGQWINGDHGEEVLVSNSPEYILRFSQVSPAVEKIKKEMWRSLKGVLQRLAVKS